MNDNNNDTATLKDIPDWQIEFNQFVDEFKAAYIKTHGADNMWPEQGVDPKNIKPIKERDA